MIIYKDKQYGFYELFNEENGTLIRSDIDGADPERRSFPELLDVGIMGHCHNGKYCSDAGIDCYQCGWNQNTPHMSIGDFEQIASQSSGKVFQIALGGAGDPNKHPDFEEILKICRYYRIVPNVTTSGFQITDEEIRLIKQYCGAVAVSWYSRLVEGEESNIRTLETVKRFVDADCITNVHFVVSTKTLEEAIIRLLEDRFPDGLNAVVFILYKPVGEGVAEKSLSENDERLKKFFDLVLQKHPYQIGFDTCFTPAILRFGRSIHPSSIDACEAATFSMYIDSQMHCHPCSFGIWDDGIIESLREKSIREVWDGKQFSDFRNRKKEKCVNCNMAKMCRSGCPLDIDIDLCNPIYD